MITVDPLLEEENGKRGKSVQGMGVLLTFKRKCGSEVFRKGRG